MKKGLFVLAFQFSILNCQFAYAQWWTAWSPKTGLALCLHQADTLFELYSPLQSPTPLPVSKWSLQNDTLRFECSSIGLKLTLIHSLSSPKLGEVAARSADGGVCSEWHGTWRQGLLREAISFLPADTLYQLRRPQTPQPPYPYTEETLAADYIDSHGDTIHLEGTLTVPRDSVARRHPALLLVSGSGQQNRDEELFQHRPFLVLADFLARHGIATLRYDDRGVGASRGPLDSATTLTFAEDAEALFNVLKRHPAVNPARIGIGGHSEGAAIAPIIATRNKEVKYVVMLAGQGCTGLDIMVQQNEALFRSRGVSPRLCALRAACMRDLLSRRDGPPASSRQETTVGDLQTVILRHTDGLTKEEIDSIDLRKGMAYSLKQQLDLPWMQAFLALDPASYLPNVQCPVLALCGDRDCQVPAQPNLQRIKQLCPKAETHELPGLNHLFQHCSTGSPDEYIQIEETFAPEAMRLILGFLLAHELLPAGAPTATR